MLQELDLERADPLLFNALLQMRMPADVVRGGVRRNNCHWKSAGPGPVAFIGNTWSNGVLMAPRYLIAGDTQMVALDFTWNDTKLGEWAAFSEVRLLIADAHSERSWTVDVTHQKSGALIVPAIFRMPANVSVIVQLAAGTRTGKLLRPPYIGHAQVQAHYRTSV
jgi:hypothetical protein